MRRTAISCFSTVRAAGFIALRLAGSAGQQVLVASLDLVFLIFFFKMKPVHFFICSQLFCKGCSDLVWSAMQALYLQQIILLDLVPVNWLWDYCTLITIACLCFLLLLIPEDAPSLSLLFCSQSIACLNLHTQTHIERKQTYEWTDQYENTSLKWCYEYSPVDSRDVLGPSFLLLSCALIAGQLLCKECWVCASLSGQRVFTHLALDHNNSLAPIWSTVCSLKVHSAYIESQVTCPNEYYPAY